MATEQRIGETMNTTRSRGGFPQATLESLVRLGCLRALNEQNRDPYSPTYGCFDRRFWAWKLVDFPEATYQRLVYPLTWLLREAERSGDSNAADAIAESIVAGLHYATRIQHRDGSFDQAFPHEHSYGATAFLVHPLLTAYEVVRERCTAEQRLAVEGMAFRGAEFLRRHREAHGRITNHLAGGVLSLLTAARTFGHDPFAQRGGALLDDILETQSGEGWFPEYGGADPGYQTLCLYYLASSAALRPTPVLTACLERSVEFLGWFAHPDGSFGGEYGRRRTALYYPGGIALLARESVGAEVLSRTMMEAILGGRTTTVATVDIANLGPLLSNYVLAADVAPEASARGTTAQLPWVGPGASRDFPEAGLYLRTHGRTYAIIGASGGGVVKIFDRAAGQLLFEDAGYVGDLDGAGLVTSQVTGMQHRVDASASAVEVESPFVHLGTSVPTPHQYLVLRMLNLTLMRSIRVGNWVKGILVRMLIQPGRRVAVTLTRRVELGDTGIRVRDRITANPGVRFRWLEGGRPFVSIHMASARYLDGASALSRPRASRRADVAQLAATGSWESVIEVG